MLLRPTFTLFCVFAALAAADLECDISSDGVTRIPIAEALSAPRALGGPPIHLLPPADQALAPVDGAPGVNNYLTPDLV